ncbi:MAG: IS21 family transposase [Gammaproteobacteria bacterium]|nr:MAG: IS21 family transposase [Gammaproteobacteria bacterium]
MPGKSITRQQVKLYMSYRKNHSQVKSAAKAGISERSARRIEIGEHQAQQQQPRQYRTRKDPFNGLFEKHLVPLLKDNPALQPITLLDVLADKAPEQFDHSHLRTLQRRVKRWRAKEGPEQEVMFLQRHIPGNMGISDYTWMNKLNITLNGNEFKHKLYHYRLVYSGWTYVQVTLGGESFESLSSGLQNAFWRSGGVPMTHRTDSLSAAFKNHSEETLLTERYAKLCKHYGVNATRNNKGIAHENGAIESAHGHLKRKIDQQLMLRGSRDFNHLADYETFINLIVAKINRQCKTRFEEEKPHLHVLPSRRTNDFSELHVKVNSSSTITVKRVLYTVPSRLVGTALLIHIYDDRLALFYGHELTLTLPRLYAQGSTRTRCIDYRHVIHSLAKKPNAFRNSLLRDDLIPHGDFTLIWEQLTQNVLSDSDCKYMVDLLVLADNYACEQALGRYVLSALEQDKQVSIKQCRELFGPDTIEVPWLVSQQHSLTSYDCLIGGVHG